MSPQRPLHAATLQWAADSLRELLAGKATIRGQLPITLRPSSEPEPDIAAVRIDPRRYLDRHPTYPDIFLLIEVAETTLEKDRQQKAPTYARANIPEYWILDKKRCQVYVFRQPGAVSYEQETLLKEGANISPLAFPEIEVQMEGLFP